MKLTGNLDAAQVTRWWPERTELFQQKLRGCQFCE